MSDKKQRKCKVRRCKGWHNSASLSNSLVVWLLHSLSTRLNHTWYSHSVLSAKHVNISFVFHLHFSFTHSHYLYQTFVRLNICRCCKYNFILRCNRINQERIFEITVDGKAECTSLFTIWRGLQYEEDLVFNPSVGHSVWFEVWSEREEAKSGKEKQTLWCILHPNLPQFTPSWHSDNIFSSWM